MATIFMSRTFRLVDSGVVIGIAAAFFFLPVVFHFVMSGRRMLTANLGSVRKGYFACCGVLLLFSGFLLFNGALDAAPAQIVKSFVIRKSISRSKSSYHYHLTIYSWRPDRPSETLEVSSAKYQSLSVDQSIQVQIHPGLFGIPWYGDITPVSTSTQK